MCGFVCISVGVLSMFSMLSLVVINVWWCGDVVMYVLLMCGEWLVVMCGLVWCCGVCLLCL